MPGKTRPKNSVYHFLVPDRGMVDYSNRAVKALVPEEMAAVKEWKKNFIQPFSRSEILQLVKLSQAVDTLYAEHVKKSRELRQLTRDPMNIYGQPPETGEITSVQQKDRLRQSPPDILLTNYKMLDYLLTRPQDARLWADNGPDTLKYLVVDELHTFDGAQGTDLACLIRRLKDRLHLPEHHLCCVGTSATLGDKSQAEKLISYAQCIFGEPFGRTALITESRKSASEFLGETVVNNITAPDPDQASDMDPEQFDTRQAYLLKQYELWFHGTARESDLSDPEWRTKLGEKLKGHLLFQNMVKELKGRIISLEELWDRLSRIIKGTDSAPARFPQLLLGSLISLISLAQRDAGTDDNGHPICCI